MANQMAEGQIITIEDFMDSLIFYLTPTVPNYQKKVTLVLDNGTKMILAKGQNIGYYHNYTHTSGEGGCYRDGNVVYYSNIAVGTTIWNGNKNGKNYYNAQYSGIAATPTRRVTKIVDPADNSIYDGVDKHTIEAKMPVAGELISIADIKNLLVNTGSTMHQYTDIFVYEWYNIAYENQKRYPYWSDPGITGTGKPGNGWFIDHSWSFRLLSAPKTTTDGLYGALAAADQIQDETLISVTQLQNMTTFMYNTANSLGYDYMHHLTCHKNCHHNCHRKRHW